MEKFKLSVGSSAIVKCLNKKLKNMIRNTNPVKKFAKIYRELQMFVT